MGGGEQGEMTHYVEEKSSFRRSTSSISELSRRFFHPKLVRDVVELPTAHDEQNVWSSMNRPQRETVSCVPTFSRASSIDFR